MHRSNSRAGLSRSGSTRSIGSNAESNATRSAAAAAASALAAAQRRNSIDSVNGAKAAAAAAAAPQGLQRRGSTSSVRSNVTSVSNRPGQYTAVRQTGSRRLYGNANANATTAAATAATATRSAPSTQSSVLRETMRSKPPQVSNTQRRQQNISSSASVRSFQSDLERINEDYNKTYAYAGQTSASAMKVAAPGSVRGRRAESVVSSAMSDTSEALGPNDAVARRKASRVSFSDVDDNEGRSRNPSPNPERKRSAMKQASPALVKTNGTGRGVPAVTSMPPPALIRRASNSSIRSNTSAGLGNTPVLAPPIIKSTPATKEAKGEDGDLSTIGESNSAYSDADEDFKASPAIKRQAATVATADGTGAAQTLQLTKQNLSAVPGGAPTAQATPMKSAMKKTPSQTGSARFQRLETDSQLDVADDESDDSDDSFAARRRAKKVGGRRSLTTLRGDSARKVREPVAATTNGGQASNGRASVQRSNSVTSLQSRTSQEPARMVSLRQSSGTQPRRQSLQGSRVLSNESVPGLSRRTSMQSLRTAQPPIPPKSVRRGSVAGSIAESVRSDAVTNHIAVMEIAQQRVQKMLHPDAGSPSNALDTFANAPERKKTSFERKRPSGLTRQHSSSSMVDRSFRTSMRPEPAPEPKSHRRAASDDRAFATTLRGAQRPNTQRSNSMIFTSSNAVNDTQSMPATPKKGRRMSFVFGRKPKDAGEAANIPPVPAMRRYSSDSDAGRPVVRKDAGTALSAGTLRSPPAATAAASRPQVDRGQSEISYSKRTGKPKKFQALRRLFRIKD